ncbi:MAG: acyl-CoA dehydrogenase [Albidovulum sp.]|nr:acyl-CoA dehydrogenase [Albidovulum sp.]
MSNYLAPVRDSHFVMHETLRAHEMATPGYDELDPEFTRDVLDAAARLASDEFAPLNRVGDKTGCRLENGGVRTPPGFVAAIEKLREGGWFGLEGSLEYGGQGLPSLLSVAVDEYFASANLALSIYKGLTKGAIQTIESHGTEKQKKAYLPRLNSGKWLATMNLTEPHCGTDLRLLKTAARPLGRGSYAISGEKIFISSGDHDLSENVVHLLLAKIPGGPEGSKGISLFIVPKFQVSDDGAQGQRNGISVSRLEAKMGINGNATCALRYEESTGQLLGEKHGGLRAMFTMMNNARLHVGMQGYAAAEAAYQSAAAYAQERLQGRAATGAKYPGLAADPIVVHPDIRRNLLDQKSFVEGARALTLWCAMLIDSQKRAGAPDSAGLVSFLTPVIKGFLTDKGFEAAVAAQQVFGGHGYIEELEASQHVRDARITMIYEGANGVQALDLVGRKLGADGGKSVKWLLRQMTELADREGESWFREKIQSPLGKSADDLGRAAAWLAEKFTSDPDSCLAGSYDFMHLTGHACLGFMWAKMVLAAAAALEENRGDEEFLRAKIATGCYYMSRQLPATGLHLERILSGGEYVMALSDSEFLAHP